MAMSGMRDFHYRHPPSFTVKPVRSDSPVAFDGGNPRRSGLLFAYHICGAADAGELKGESL